MAICRKKKFTSRKKVGEPEIGAVHKSQKVGGPRPARPNRLHHQCCSVNSSVTFFFFFFFFLFLFLFFFVLFLPLADFNGLRPDYGSIYRLTVTIEHQ